MGDNPGTKASQSMTNKDANPSDPKPGFFKKLFHPNSKGKNK